MKCADLVSRQLARFSNWTVAFFILQALLLGRPGDLLSAEPHYRARYGPSPEDGFPQIIQKTDYPTIAFIESVYRNLVDRSIARRKTDEFGSTADCEISANALTFRSKETPAKTLVIRRSEDQKSITMLHTLIKDGASVILASTLFTVLNDFQARGPCQGVKLGQLGTRAYQRRTIIEFDFGNEIVVVDCFSNGPDNEERLYVLDVVGRRDSLFFHRS